MSNTGNGQLMHTFKIGRLFITVGYSLHELWWDTFEGCKSYHLAHIGTLSDKRYTGVEFVFLNAMLVVGLLSRGEQ